MQKHSVAALVAATLACACASATEQRLALGSLPAPGPSAPAALEFAGYPTQANFGIVYAEATFYTNHEDIFRTDFLEEGVVPIALKIGTRGEGQDIAQISLSPERMDLHLYLEDGTALAFVPSGEVQGVSKRGADQVVQESLRPGLLSRWDAAPEGFVYFRLAPKDAFEADETRVEHQDGEISRRLDLMHSLVGMTLTTELGERQLFVGLSTNRRVIKR